MAYDSKHISKIILVLITPNNIIETLRALFVDHTRLVVGLLIVH